MKISILLSFVLISAASLTKAQNTSHRAMTFGSKPDKSGLMDAARLESFMGNKTRISATIKGRILAITKSKGGWFTLDAGNGRTISAHFKEYNINLPASLKGRTAIVEGIVEKPINAADQQHFAGNSESGKKRAGNNQDSNQHLTFEVKGLMVE